MYGQISCLYIGKDTIRPFCWPKSSASENDDRVSFEELDDASPIGHLELQFLAHDGMDHLRTKDHVGKETLVAAQPHGMFPHAGAHPLGRQAPVAPRTRFCPPAREAPRIAPGRGGRARGSPRCPWLSRPGRADSGRGRSNGRPPWAFASPYRTRRSAGSGPSSRPRSLASPGCDGGRGHTLFTSIARRSRRSSLVSPSCVTWSRTFASPGSCRCLLQPAQGIDVDAGDERAAKIQRHAVRLPMLQRHVQSLMTAQTHGCHISRAGIRRHGNFWRPCCHRHYWRIYYHSWKSVRQCRCSASRR